MRFLLKFIRMYPFQSLIVLGGFIFSELFEGIGLTMLLPLLSLTIKGGQTDGAVAGVVDGDQLSSLERGINNFFAAIGLDPTIEILLTAFVICISAKCLLSLVVHKRVGYTVARVTTDIRLRFIRALFVSRWEYFIRQPIGALTNAIATETGRSAAAFLESVRMVVAISRAIMFAGIAFLISWQATLTALLAGISIFFLFSGLITKARNAGKEQTTMLQSLIARMTDSLQSIKPLKSMAREDSADAVLSKDTKKLQKAVKKQVSSRQALVNLPEPIITVFVAVGIYFSLVQWQFPLASVLMMVFMITKILKSMRKAQGLYQNVAIQESAYWSFTQKLHETESARENNLGSKTPSLSQSILLKNVSFTYENLPVLENASLNLSAGSFSAIVGPSGAGKTTLADLIIGLLRPQKGEVYIDDTPLAEIDLFQWRRMIGYVPQDTLLLHDSIYINVTLGAKNLSEKDVESALRAAGAWDFIKAMPQGMQSVVGERGGKLSGGQRQRIAIARALVHRPKLLILDEATTALDPKTEIEILSTIRQLRGHHTILAISHQPALLDAVDQAFRLQNGKVIIVNDREREDFFVSEAAGMSAASR